VTSACFLVGAAAICALPPFNGFLSEWLVYLGLFNGAMLGWHWAVGGLVALVLTGGLALACFAKAAGIVFLGEPRSHQAAQAHETGLPERSAMILLAALCLGIGLSLPLLAPGLARAVQAAAPGISADVVTTTLTQGSAAWLSAGAGAIILGGMALWWWQRRHLATPTTAGTWDCGYAEPTTRMQYTATSFAAPLTSELHAVMLPERHLPELSDGAGVPSTAGRLFPSTAAFADHPRDPVLERLLQPLGNAAAWCCRQARVAHPGWVHLYLLYLAVTCILLLIWSLA
jgi:NADH:ubiquinone oxidoreductase subunit 5 (subunit L)/multisubunit Na+/H+ antiporter MnhA subunit